jgi:tripartite-type tricarboxylate transporter receptor subunit TctC
MSFRSVFAGLSVGFVLAAASATALAQSYPGKPIRLIVATAPATPVDIVSRVVADKLRGELGQPVVVENKPGATGTIGFGDLARQPADGYTLGTIFMPMTVAPALYNELPFDLLKDFAPISQTVWSYNVMVVHPSVRATSVRELVEVVKATPGKMAYASGGPGTPAHLAGEVFKQQMALDVLHVPYVQFPQAIGDLVAGRVQYMIMTTVPAIPQINAGKLRPLAVTSPRRIDALKDVPTMEEAGFPGLAIRDWQGFVVRKGTPKEIVDRLHAAIVKVMATPDTAAAMAKLGAEAHTNTPEQFSDWIRAEVERWTQVAKTAGLKAN